VRQKRARGSDNGGRGKVHGRGSVKKKKDGVIVADCQHRIVKLPGSGERLRKNFKQTSNAGSGPDEGRRGGWGCR